MKLIVYTDGASRGNPGPSSYGFSILDKEKKILYEEGKYLGINTNNFAEYSAVLAALIYIQKNFEKAVITFFMDSKLVVEQLSGRYKIKSLSLKVLIDQIKELENKIGPTTYSHIPREKNKIADFLANKALDSL